MFEIADESVPLSAVIKVVGVGGGGGNAVQHMVARDIEGVDFVSVNTDAQALKKLTAPTLLQLGAGVTRGLGAGANPVKGKEAAMEDRDKIVEVIDGADMVFITAGMGGGTGTGAAPVVAEVARQLGILTVAVVTTPFEFEGKKRMKIAGEGIAELSGRVDSLITIPNEKLLTIFGEKIALEQAFARVDDVLTGAVHGIADLIIKPGMINVDFADVRTVMSEMGMAMMGSGQACGESRAKLAVAAAINNPLLDDMDFTGAKGMLVNVSAGPSLTLEEFSEVNNAVTDLASDNATVVCGAVLDELLDDELKVTVVAAGLGEEHQEKVRTSIDEVTRKVAGGRHAYAEFDTPTVIRNAGVRKKPEDMDLAHGDLDLLDIPAFLRRQAD